jgi:hypothetical protein
MLRPESLAIQASRSHCHFSAPHEHAATSTRYRRQGLGGRKHYQTPASLGVQAVKEPFWCINSDNTHAASFYGLEACAAPRRVYADATCPLKLMIACFNCESTSSAIATTSSISKLKSTVLRLFCKVSNMLTCKMRDSSTIIGTE